MNDRILEELNGWRHPRAIRRFGASPEGVARSDGSAKRKALDVFLAVNIVASFALLSFFLKSLWPL